MAAKSTSKLVALLRRLDPETAHSIALAALRMRLAGTASAAPDPALRVTAFGRAFANPLGVAAGFDKDGVAVAPLARLGFGFVEVGTVTPLPQRGNPQPRLFRLEQDGAVINRMGFNNRGVDALVRRLAAGAPFGCPLGINLGINREGAEPDRDYPLLVRQVAPLADYVVINVSSPNTPGLRDLQARGRLAGILRAVAAAGPQPPLLVKLSPDLAAADLPDIVGVCRDHAVAGLVIANTTTARPAALRSAARAEAGGLSGRPLFDRSTAMLARCHQLAGGDLTLIGVGGVGSGADALAKIRAGASLVQLYTAFAYAGPPLVPHLLAELAAALRSAGFAAVAQAVGSDCERLAAGAA